MHHIDAIRQRWSFVALAVLAVLASLLVAPARAADQDAGRSAQSPTTQPIAAARAVLRVGMTVEDMERSIDFYTKVLDFEVTSDVEVAGPDLERRTGVFGARCRVVRLRLGDEELELTQYLASRGGPIPLDARSNDRWFQHIAIITSDMRKAYARLRAHDVRHASTSPQRLPDWNPNAGGIEAFYFHDPDGHVLEVLAFPAGKGLDKWQTARGLFLGIDHTAIVVADTDRSVRFYRDRLGLDVVGGSENYGDEQERLNNVRGARLRITTLRAPTGPGVELLEYLQPRDGRPYPADAAPNDIVHWETTIAGDGAGGDDLDVLVRDPDGHAVRLVSRSEH